MSESVVRAGRLLVARGKRPTGARLRAEIGRGTPHVLLRLWERHVDAGGEGDPVVVREMHAGLHAYSPPSAEEVIRAGRELLSEGVPVTGHHLRKRLGGRGVRENLESVWLAHAMVVMRPDISRRVEEVEAAILRIEERGIQEVVDALDRMRKFLGLGPMDARSA